MQESPLRWRLRVSSLPSATGVAVAVRVHCDTRVCSRYLSARGVLTAANARRHSAVFWCAPSRAVCGRAPPICGVTCSILYHLATLSRIRVLGVDRLGPSCVPEPSPSSEAPTTHDCIPKRQFCLPTLHSTFPIKVYYFPLFLDARVCCVNFLFGAALGACFRLFFYFAGLPFSLYP